MDSIGMRIRKKRVIFAIHSMMLTLLFALYLASLKIIVVGNGQVGKTSMLNRFARGIMTDKYKKTIGTGTPSLLFLFPVRLRSSILCSFAPRCRSPTAYLLTSSHLLIASLFWFVRLSPSLVGFQIFLKSIIK
jgi:hypothetical protein